MHGFDKFMNLVLMNVDEDYTVMTRIPHPYTVMVHEPADPQPQPTCVYDPDAGTPSGLMQLHMYLVTHLCHRHGYPCCFHGCYRYCHGQSKLQSAVRYCCNVDRCVACDVPFHACQTVHDKHGIEFFVKHMWIIESCRCLNSH